MPDEREKNEDRVDDLEATDEQAEEVKGGSLNFTRSGTDGIWVPQGSPAKNVDNRGGWDGNHNQTLIRI